MARRSDHTRDEIRQMAVAAGQQMIREEGFEAFSARKLAKQIGYTVGTLYNVFGNYASLIHWINAVTLDDLAHQLTRRRDASLEPEAAIKQLALAYYQFAAADTSRWRALFEYPLPDANKLADWYKAKMDGIIALFAFHLRPVLPEGEDPRRVARTLWAGIHGNCLMGLAGCWLDGDQAVDTITDINQLIEQVVDGLRFKRERAHTVRNQIEYAPGLA